MARIAYPAADSDKPDLLAQRVVEERGELLNLYRLLLHSPGLAEGWLRLGTAIGSELLLDHRTRELVVCAVAAAVGADYEWHHHAPAARAQGITEDQLAAVTTGDHTVFAPRERAVLELVEVIGRSPADAGIHVSALEQWFGAREVLELVVVVGFYWMVTRVSVGLDVDRDHS